MKLRKSIEISVGFGLVVPRDAAVVAVCIYSILCAVMIYMYLHYD